MNTLKKTLALVATLAMASTAFVGCGSDSSESTAAKTEAPKADDTTAPAGEDDTKAPETPAADGNSTEVGEVKLGTGGKTFTVVSWNAADVPYLIAQWKGLDYKNIVKDLADKKVDGIDFIEFGVGGGKFSEKFDALWKKGGDIDVYFCEADWALNYINDDTKTAALDQLGFSDANWADAYGYTAEIGRATEGANAGKMVGASWQAAAGGFAYRSDLAEQYLGVKTPAEMQEKVADWDKFVEAASTVAEKTDGKVALADSLGGMWQVFAANRTTPWVVDGKVQFDESCQKFAELAKKLWDNGGVSHNGQWGDNWVPAGQSGSTMGYFVSTWGFGKGSFLNDVASKNSGKWSVCQGPDKYFWGGTWIVVSPKTDNAQEAQDFIKCATVDPESMKAFALAKPEYVNNKTVMQQIVDDGAAPDDVKALLGGQNYFAELHENAKAIDIKGLITPYDATIKTAFIEAVEKQYCAGKDFTTTASEALKAVYKKAPDLAKGNQ